MAEPKEMVASAIVRAQADLQEALSELEKIPAFDPSAVAFAAHALNNYLTVTEGAAELMLLHLASHPDAQLQIWVEGVQQATSLMGRTVSQLMSSSATTGSATPPRPSAGRARSRSRRRDASRSTGPKGAARGRGAPSRTPRPVTRPA